MIDTNIPEAAIIKGNKTKFTSKYNFNQILKKHNINHNLQDAYGWTECGTIGQRHRNTKDNEYIFHAGTKVINSKVFSSGGRVLNFVIKSNDFKKSREKAIDLIKELNWENGFFRKDIGHKVIDK